MLKVTLPQAPPPKIHRCFLVATQRNGCQRDRDRAHIVAHPILSRLNRKQSYEEIASSKRIIEKKPGREVRPSCYPNSRPPDINPYVVETVKKVGYEGAVHEFGPDFSDLFKIPQLGVNDKVDSLWKLCGMQTLVLHRRLRTASK